jgi:aminodeoxyfutalosine deaminase
MRSFQADYIFPVSSAPIKDGIVTVDGSGKITSVTGPGFLVQNTTEPLEKLSGIICPGFVNTHCHLELSHLKGKIQKHTGLVNFIKDVQKFRGADKSEMLDAAAKADTEMYENGIVAVGDISNSDLSIPIKTASKLYYHTFVEMFGFVPTQAKTVFDRALALAKEFEPQNCSLTPHAPYSVSKDLFKLIREYCDTGENLISIHNQECDDENKFYRYKTGSFNDLYAFFGIDIGFFKAQARNSIQTVIPLLTSRQRILMVHNTCTNLKDIYFLKRFDRKISWCFCPNANLYIENAIPKVELFIGQGFNITLGTDSLASNNGLCVLNEMRRLQERIPGLNTTQLIEWATLNGAKYLGIDDETGSLEPGKTPGLNLLTGLDDLSFTPETKVKRLI